MTPFRITAFATIFVVIDPPGLVPLFIALTVGMLPAALSVQFVIDGIRGTGLIG